MKQLWVLMGISALVIGCGGGAKEESPAPAKAPPAVDSPMRSGEGSGTGGSPAQDPNATSSAPSGTNPGMGSDLSGGIQQAAKGQARDAAAAAGAGSVGAAGEGGE